MVSKIKSIMQMKKNKKAWLRIVEAFLAVLILLGSILVILSKQEVKNDLSGEITENQNKILNIISKNYTIRNWVLQNNEEKVKEAISPLLPQNLDFTIRICEVTEACGTETPNDKEIYTREILITTTLEEHNPKKLRFFVWAK